MLVRILLIVAVVAWGWSFIAAKICLEYMTPIELVGLRLLVGVPAMFAVAAFRRIRFDVSSAVRARLLVASGILTIHFIIQAIGLKYTSATNTAWIIAVIPLALVIMSYLFLGERVDGNDKLGIGVASAGILVLVSGGELGSLGWVGSVGDWLILASAHTWALYTVVTRNALRGRDSLAVTSSILLPACLVLLIYMIATSNWSKFMHLPAQPVVAMLYLGFISLAVAHWFWQEGVSRIGAARAGLFLYFEPLATTALAVPLLHEHFGVSSVIGGLLVLSGVYLSQRRRKQTELIHR